MSAIVPNKLDRNANTEMRLRRNAQRTAAGGATSSVLVNAPLTNTGGVVTLSLATSSGLFNNSGLSVHVSDTSLTLAAGGVSVNLNTTGGLQTSSGVKIKLADTSFVLSGTGVGLNLAASSGLQISAGVSILAADSSLSLSGSGVQVHLATNGGLTVNTGVKILLADTSLALGVSGINVSLATNSGLQTSSGLLLKLTDTSLVLAGTGVAVNLAANSGLQISSGLLLKLNGTSLQLGASGVSVRGFPTTAPGTPADGDAWYDATAKCVTHQQDGESLKMGGLLDLTTADSANVANTLVATTVYTFTFPASYFVAGKAFELEFQGEYSTDPTAAAPAMLVQANLAGGDIADSGIITLPQNASNFRFNFSGFFVCRATGNPASFGRSGMYVFELSGAGTSNYFRPAGGAVFSGGNTAGTIALTITIGWGTALATNTAHLHQVKLKALN